mmetsp:Transcript_49706/g.78672  ORF Transcript_49706/g.78672 Transcript_49706/m.78672 type:complete len:300 (-) Transcript_49706:22-921(-)
MVSIVENTDIEVDDVSILQRSTIGNTMAYDLICRDANCFGKSVIIERARVNLPINASLIHYTVDLVTCNAFFHVASSYIEHLSSEAAGLSHPLQVLAFQNWNLLRAIPLGEANAVGVSCVVRHQYVLRHLHLRRHESRPQTPRERETIECHVRLQQLFLGLLIGTILRCLERGGNPRAPLLIIDVLRHAFATFLCWHRLTTCLFFLSSAFLLFRGGALNYAVTLFFLIFTCRLHHKRLLFYLLVYWLLLYCSCTFFLRTPLFLLRSTCGESIQVLSTVAAKVCCLVSACFDHGQGQPIG